MKTIEISHVPHPVGVALGALLSSTKRPGVIKTLPKVTYVRPSVVLDADHVAAYTRVCGLQSAQGVPLIYPQLLTFPLAMAFFGSEHCPWPALGTVHLANRIHQHLRMQAGDDLRVEMRTGELLAHEKGQVFHLEMAILRDDVLVWEATQTLLRLGVKTPSGKAFVSSLAADVPLSRQSDFVAPANTGRRYAKVTGDFNPIHLAAPSAKLFGFRQAIAHGLWTTARALAPLVPDAPLAQAELDVEFKTPLFLPASASLWSARKPQGALFEVRNAKGDKPHVRGRLRYQAD
jgi:acyl dehydratase